MVKVHCFSLGNSRQSATLRGFWPIPADFIFPVSVVAIALPSHTSRSHQFWARGPSVFFFAAATTRSTSLRNVVLSICMPLRNVLQCRQLVNSLFNIFKRKSFWG